MTTLTIKVNDNNDLYLPDGRNLFIIENQDALVQTIGLAHKMRKGEDLYDVNNGIDYLGVVFTSPVDEDTARQQLSNAILKKVDVLGIETLVTTISNNALDFEAQIVTAYGDTIKVGTQS